MIESRFILKETLEENLAKLDSDYDTFILLLYLIGWPQRQIAIQLGQSKQAIQHIVAKCKKRMEIE